MTNLRTAAQQALEALEDAQRHHYALRHKETDALIAALKAALAEPVQEPVAWKDKTYESLHHQDFGNSIPLYTAPPQRKPLTDEEIKRLVSNDMVQFARAIERAHGICE